MLNDDVQHAQSAHLAAVVCADSAMATHCTLNHLNFLCFCLMLSFKQNQVVLNSSIDDG